ncbi:MAG: CRISPR-associated endonuclease Cas2 [Patescibacteria group bacterium]
MKPFWVITYDIPHHKRRRKVASILEGHGRRAQYSVFECDLDSEQIKSLEKRLRDAIDETEDDIRFYPLNQADLKRVRLLGKANIEREKSFYLV